MRNKLVSGALIGLLAAAAALLLDKSGLLEGWEAASWKWRVQFFAPRHPPRPDIKVILLDQTTLDWGKTENGWPWPWPRTVYTAILDFCRRGGAKAVVFDVLYTEPSGFDASDDEAFGQAIAKTPGFVGALFLGGATGQATNWPSGIPHPVPEADLNVQLAAPPARDPRVFQRAVFPIPEVSTNAALLANVSDQPDADGIFRRASLWRVFDGKVVPSAGIAAYLAGEKAAGHPPLFRIENDNLLIGPHRAPTDASGNAILHFVGPKGTHTSYSAAAVIQSELRLQEGKTPVLDPAVVSNAYVFFGFSAPGLLDLRPVPINRVYPGVEIHATVLDNLLSGSFLRPAPFSAVAPVTAALALLSSLLILAARRASHTVIVIVALVPLPVMVGFAAYELGWWWPLVGTESGVALALASGVILNYATEGRKKTFLKRAFKHYLGAEVIDQIIADPSRLQLGGEKRELTLFFSDIEKFSSFSERLDPATLTSLLNDYLSDMTDLILEEGGYLDKYIGDAIVAFWNAPATQSDHAIRACRTVLRCQRLLAERRPLYEQRTGVILKARIGMHTGDVTVGNMGSRNRFNYTVLGDAANLASRLEGANKHFGTYALISEATWKLTQGQFVGRELGAIRVVGRQQPVTVFEPIGFTGEPIPEHVADFNRGLAHCRSGQWGEALRCFEKHPNDPASTLYAAKCKSLLHEPSTVWDTVWSLTEK